MVRAMPAVNAVLQRRWTGTVENGRADQVRLSTTAPDHRHPDPRITFADLQTRVAAVAGCAYKRMAWAKATLIIYMPNGSPEARLRPCWPVPRIAGQVALGVFAGFAANENGRADQRLPPKPSSPRLRVGNLVARVVANKRLLDGAIEQDPTINPIFCLHPAARTSPCASDTSGARPDWHDAQKAHAPCPLRLPLEGNHPAYILIPPARLAHPRAVDPPDRSAHLVALNWTMKNIYNVDARRRVLGRTDVGWAWRPQLYLLWPAGAMATDRRVRRPKPVGQPDAGTFCARYL